MKKKKILIISRYFYPINTPRSLRTTELVKEFSRKGHEVTLITSKNNDEHIAFEKEFGVTIKDLGKQKFKEIDIKNGNKYAILIKRAVRRGLIQLIEYPNIELMFNVKGALKKEIDYDLLISIAAPHPVHWGVGWARTNKNPIAKTWVADCGDPFMLDKSDSFRKMFYFKYFEKNWGKKVDFIAVPFDGAIKGYYPEFQSKIKVIPQGFSFPMLNTKVEFKNDVLTLVYSGSIGPYKHYYKPFFDQLKNTNEDFKFIVFTKEAHIYREELSEIIDKVEINDYVPREELFKTLVRADFLIHFPYQNNQQKSLKLIDYNYSRKPILSYQGIKDNDKLNDFLKGNFNMKMNFEDIEPFKIKNVCQQFLDLV